MAKKTDNHNAKAKLDLRRAFLRKYHADDPPHVLDCCQGSGVLWKELRKEFTLGSYWGVDLKEKKGRLRVDSVRILQQPGWPQNVVDIDTYGSPWKHWAAMLPNIQQPVTVFLTIGQAMGKKLTTVPPAVLDAMGISRLPGWQYGRFGRPTLNSREIPQSLVAKAAENGVSYVLARACDYGIIVVEAVEVVDGRSNQPARYLGLRLEPAKKDGEPGVVTPAQPKRRRSKQKETTNV